MQKHSSEIGRVTFFFSVGKDGRGEKRAQWLRVLSYREVCDNVEGTHANSRRREAALIIFVFFFEEEFFDCFA